ncbi:MAG: Ig-like domain-containing protein [candidate division Zixibacteria bacterium]|nr:Ig-like domain-containing protein [candidate division Zixibacteria bacterium]
MKRLLIFSVVLILLMLFLSGCTDENNITNVLQTKSAIVGKVVNYEPGMTVSAWQAIEIKKVTVDNAGYFSIADLNPGLYEVRFFCPTGARKTIRDVEVKSSETTLLGEIMMIHMPWPFVESTPGDGLIKYPPLSSSIMLSSEELLDFGSLSTAIIFDPPIAGQWDMYHYYGDIYNYSFRPTPQLRAATHYHVNIRPNLRLFSGEEWSDSLTFSFDTDSLRLCSAMWHLYGETDTIAVDFRGSLIEFRYNSLLDPATVGGAIHIEPPIDFAAVPDDTPTSVILQINGGLVSGTRYLIIIDKSLKDIFGAAPVKGDTISFYTEKFEVEQRDYPSTLDNVSPRATNGLLRYRFSIPPDPSSARASISIDPPVDLHVSIERDYYGPDWLFVGAAQGLRPGTTYSLTIDSTLSAIDGTKIGTIETVLFEVQPLMVIRNGASNGYYSSDLDSIIDPGESFNYRIYLNADVDIDSFNLAASISPELPGFWYQRYEYDYSQRNPYLAFFPTGPINLAAEQTYTITIDGSVGLVMGAGFGEDLQMRLHINPVIITSLYPSPGTQNFGISNNIAVEFNAPMDHATTEAAFSMTTWDGTPVSGTFNWYYYDDDRRMIFYPTSYLTPLQTYKVNIATTARSQSGAYLKEAGYTFFRTEG